MILELVLLVVGLFFAWNYLGRPKNFPPGPYGIPILGHLHSLGTEPYKTLMKWKKTHGPIIGIWFGSYRTVVIHDSKLIRESMGMNTFAGRPMLQSFITARSDGITRGIVFTEGQLWSEQRRFALRNLRDFGFGTKTMEAKVQEEIRVLLDMFKANEGKPIQVRNVFNTAAVNALWSIMFGERLDQDDPEVKDAMNRITSSFEEANILANLATFIPWIGTWFPKLSGFTKMIAEAIPLNNFMNKQIESHNEHYEEDQPRDFVDAYTDEVRKTTDTNSSFHPQKGEMLFALLDLFVAGSETTSTTLSWMCAYLIRHPEVQEKLQKEIDEVVGKERLPALADRPSMPYAEAVISEVLRYSSIVPMVMHKATEDLEFHGFFIPKDTIVIPNFYGAHFDETVWGDPENFRPERFLHEDGKFKKNENLFPFSTGKRACIGESLARDELFLFSITFYQTFVVTPSGDLPSMEPHQGFSLSPKPFKMILKQR